MHFQQVDIVDLGDGRFRTPICGEELFRLSLYGVESYWLPIDLLEEKLASTDFVPPSTVIESTVVPDWNVPVTETAFNCLTRGPKR
jgi:hypothetical protein